MIISIGDACNVKHHIDTYVTQPTHFFDWLMVDLPSVIQLISTKDIATVLRRENLLVESIPNRTQVTMKALDNCVSIHDVPVEYTGAHIDIFIDQYTRRYERLVATIKSGEKIVFIRWGTASNSLAARFVAAVKNINERCPFILILLGDKSAPLKNNILRMKLKERPVLPTDIAWHKSHYLWEDVWAQCASFIGATK